MANALPVSRGSAANNSAIPARPGSIASGDMQVMCVLAPSTRSTLTTPSGWTLHASTPIVASAPRGWLLYKTYVPGEASPSFAGTGSGTYFAYLEAGVPSTIDIAGGFLQSWGFNPRVGTSNNIPFSSPSGVGVTRIDGAFRGIAAASYTTTPSATYTPDARFGEIYDAVPSTEFAINIVRVDDITDVGTLSGGWSTTLSTVVNKVADLHMFYVLNPVLNTRKGLTPLI